MVLRFMMKMQVQLQFYHQALIEVQLIVYFLFKMVMLTIQ
jgi:hypothetical protein